MCLRILALLVICQIPLFGMTAASAYSQEAEISLKLEDSSVIQGEELPEFRASAEAKGDLEIVLDERSEYTVGDLLRELETGTGYTVVCDADSMTEGEYPMHIQLADHIRDALKKKWVRLVRLETQDAVFTVKNPVGEWEDDRFRRYDGTYVRNDFVVSKGNTYYFGDDEKMKTGWQNINGSDYYFTQEGKMMTGVMYLGLTKCIFGEDGVFLSKEEIDVDPNKPMVALTFDDGPGKRTGELLDALEEHRAHATFFMLGKSMGAYPNEIKRMKKIGCETASHSYDHPNLSKMDETGIRDQVDRTDQKLSEIIGEGASLIRPPYGAISDTMKASVGMPMILWNIDTLDWKTRNAEATVNTVMESVKDGDIILMHDIHTESVDAAVELIPKLIDAGFQLVTVSEMAAAKGIVLENGKSYTDF